MTPFGSVGLHSAGNIPRFSVYSLTMFYSLLIAKKKNSCLAFQTITQEKTCVFPFIALMGHGTSWTPTHLSHLWAHQKSMSFHPAYPPDQQPACSPSTQACDILPTTPKKQEPLAIYLTTLASESTQRLCRRQHIIASHANPTLMITVYRWWVFIDHHPPLWHPWTFLPFPPLGFSIFVYVYTSYCIYMSMTMDDCIRCYFSCTLHPSTLPQLSLTISLCAPLSSHHRSCKYSHYSIICY